MIKGIYKIECIVKNKKTGCFKVRACAAGIWSPIRNMVQNYEMFFIKARFFFDYEKFSTKMPNRFR